MLSYSPTNNPSPEVLRLVLLTIMLRPSWEAPGKAEAWMLGKLERSRYFPCKERSNAPGSACHDFIFLIFFPLAGGI